MKKRTKKYYDPNIKSYDPMGGTQPVSSNLDGTRLCKESAVRGDEGLYYNPVSKCDVVNIPEYEIKTFTDVSVNRTQASFKRKETRVMQYQPMVTSKPQNRYSSNTLFSRKYRNSHIFFRIVKNIECTIDRWYKILNKLIQWKK